MRVGSFMKRVFPAVLGAVALGALAGCQGGDGGVSNGGHRPTAATANGAAGSSGSSSATSSATTTTGTTGAGATSGTTGSGTGATTTGTTGTACVNLQCKVQQCAGGAHTTISGTIKDPAGKNPLYNIVAYIPNAAIQPLPSGASCASCSSLFSGSPMAVALSDNNGHFSIKDAPVDTNVDVVVQVGKWRTHHVVSTVNACVDNPVGDIKLPSKMVAGDPIINLPDIAISTGQADTLECLLTRIGVDHAEYVAGNSRTGKVHVFKGGDVAGNTPGAGAPSAQQLSGSPESRSALWNSQAQLMAHDIVLLSCEGGETFDAKPANLESYLNNGGRVFASHYHYAWFTGAIDSNPAQTYTAPGPWGNNLANWQSGSNAGPADPTLGDVNTTLPNGQPFYKGQALSAWLGNTRALQGGKLPINTPRENALVTASNAPSTPWINNDPDGATLYFSFDTPIGALAPTDGGAQFCGRGVFSGLHVGAASGDYANNQPPPSGCNTGDLSPQEKALEFMLFDLSSCVVSDSVNPADAGGIIFN
jgi:hypothetical protein